MAALSEIDRRAGELRRPVERYRPKGGDLGGIVDADQDELDLGAAYSIAQPADWSWRYRGEIDYARVA